MNKQEFLEELKKGLAGLPENDIEERLNFYGEIIDDRVEEGLKEDEAVLQTGNVNEIVSQIISDIPVSKIVKDKIKQTRKPKAWEIVLLVMGFPLWLPLVIAAAAVILSLYVIVWAVIISIWAVFVSVVIGGAIGGIISGVRFAFCGFAFQAAAFTGAGVLCAGLGIFMFFGCKQITKGTLFCTKKFAVWLKGRFVKRGEA